MAQQPLANSNPIIPETSSFWNHLMHLDDDRYGGLTTYNHEYYTGEVFYKSTISSDTKFWVRGAGGQYLTSFEETQNFNRNNNFNQTSGLPTSTGCSDCVSGSYQFMVNTSPITWDNISHGTDFWFVNNTEPNSTINGTQYSSSYFQYINGVLTKCFEDADHSANPFFSPGEFTPISLLSKFRYVTDNTNTGSATNWYVTSSSGVGNDWQPAGIHTYGEALVQAINEFVPQLTASSFTNTLLYLESSICNNDNSSIEQVYSIDFYASSSLLGVTSASSVPVTYEAAGYATNSFNGQYMYHSYYVSF